MTISNELIAAILGGILLIGGFIGKQLAKFLAENKKDIELELRVKSLEERLVKVEEEQVYARRHKSS